MICHTFDRTQMRTKNSWMTSENTSETPDSRDKKAQSTRKRRDPGIERPESALSASQTAATPPLFNLDVESHLPEILIGSAVRSQLQMAVHRHRYREQSCPELQRVSDGCLRRPHNCSKQSLSQNFLQDCKA